MTASHSRISSADINRNWSIPAFEKFSLDENTEASPRHNYRYTGQSFNGQVSEAELMAYAYQEDDSMMDSIEQLSRLSGFHGVDNQTKSESDAFITRVLTKNFAPKPSAMVKVVGSKVKPAQSNAPSANEVNNSSAMAQTVTAHRYSYAQNNPLFKAQMSAQNLFKPMPSEQEPKVAVNATVVQTEQTENVRITRTMTAQQAQAQAQAQAQEQAQMLAEQQSDAASQSSTLDKDSDAVEQAVKTEDKASVKQNDTEGSVNSVSEDTNITRSNAQDLANSEHESAPLKSAMVFGTVEDTAAQASDAPSESNLKVEKAARSMSVVGADKVLISTPLSRSGSGTLIGATGRNDVIDTSGYITYSTGKNQGTNLGQERGLSVSSAIVASINKNHAYDEAPLTENKGGALAENRSTFYGSSPLDLSAPLPTADMSGFIPNQKKVENKADRPSKAQALMMNGASAIFTHGQEKAVSGSTNTSITNGSEEEEGVKKAVLVRNNNTFIITNSEQARDDFARAEQIVREEERAKAIAAEEDVGPTTVITKHAVVFSRKRSVAEALAEIADEDAPLATTNPAEFDNSQSQADDDNVQAQSKDNSAKSKGRVVKGNNVAKKTKTQDLANPLAGVSADTDLASNDESLDALDKFESLSSGSNAKEEAINATIASVLGKGADKDDSVGDIKNSPKRRGRGRRR